MAGLRDWLRWKNLQNIFAKDVKWQTKNDFCGKRKTKKLNIIIIIKVKFESTS